MNIKLLFVAAFGPELKALKKIYKNRKDIAFANSGIGFTSAAAKTAEIILKNKPKKIIFIGSSGSYNRKIPLLSIICANESRIADFVLANKKSYNPKNFPSKFVADKKLFSVLKKQKDFKVYFSTIHSSLSITTNKKIVSSFLEKGNYFENLELYGVAQACQNLNVPWNAISVVTNYIGKNAHQQWLENYNLAAEETSSIITSLNDNL